MIIHNCKRTCKTAKLMKQMLPRELKNERILINLGDGYLDESKYRGYKIINRTSAIRNCSNKKKMFKLFQENNIQSVRFIEFDESTEPINELGGKILVLRKGGKIVLRTIRGNCIPIPDKWIYRGEYEYATIKEEKVKEYRVILFRGKIVRAMRKMPQEDDFQLKQENCKFVTITPESSFPRETIGNMIKAQKVLGIDLCGIDLLKNTDGEWKILEVNSGMSMSPRSVEIFYKMLMEEQKSL
jgi:hypothetical protein